ncbi:PH domain-containing protein [Kytococcus sedentarius]|uniref:PH domain-containing protein n=1 Tax=Kytococcus sedentarius TaxID=1276 RepID=UPI0035BBDC6E
MSSHPTGADPTAESVDGAVGAGRPAQVVHPKKARILAVISWLLAVCFIVLALVTRPMSWVTVWLAIAGSALAWVLIWRPRITLDPYGLTIVNPVRTTTVPWQRMRRVGSRWSLEVESEKGMHRAWAVGSSFRDPSGLDHSADVTGLGLLRPEDARRRGQDPDAPPAATLPEDLQHVASTVRGARDAHADALTDGVIEADPTPTRTRIEPLPAAAFAVGLLLPLLVWAL